MPTAEEMLSTASVVALGACLRRADPANRFARVRTVPPELAAASFSERGRLVREALLADLPEDFASLDRVIRAALPDPAFTGWMIWPVTEAVAVRAVARDEFEAGLVLLAELTPRLTAEFALRIFLTADLDRTLAVVTKWADHPDEHVRRLASEGTRQRLPWAKQVPQLFERTDVTRPILEALRADDSEYVRRSVANHLNDLSRTDPALAVEIAGDWLADPVDTTAQLVRHALRTLIKAGDPAALELLGYRPPTALVVDGPVLGATAVVVGETLAFSFDARNDGPDEVRLAIDYVVHHVKANGTLAPKVFKLTTRTLGPGESTSIAKRHSFKPISTRRYHAGEHALELQINGRPFGRAVFTLALEEDR
ncbi:3-methyladenine DNA glycosylase AlkC [Kribbella amoyensis]|uniref:3-methyladenine DNA glycosylase AlkC n=1 Tax=Kribbella amoyensis TaxID=996641 RepID=A0A561B8S0_9ACTN|nr:DNA alkylation repair protein [Kribbella amoyensis]TWD75082.1 3-methyladenine DNA glycosylase AlkC [Kribbella amoyensis]